MAVARVGWLNCLALSGLVLVACQSSTHVGGYACYPAHVDQTAADYCLWIDIEGAAGKAFVERSQKRIRLSILTDQKEVALEREYSAEAGDLGWFSAWPELSDLRIIFFEYGETQTPGEENRGPAKMPRQVFTVAFTSDQAAGTFTEAPAPSEVFEEASRRDERENRRHVVEISFIDSEENETRILEDIRNLALDRGLEVEEPQAGIVGDLAEYSAGSFSLVFQRQPSLGRLAVVMQDYGNRELTDYIAGRLRDLPAFVGTRRHVSINFRLGPQDLETVVRSVDAVAAKYGLGKSDRQDTSKVAI